MQNPDTTPYQTEFLAPFDLPTCAERIENLTEEGRFFAFDWEHRIKATVKQVDANNAEFSIKKIQKSNARMTIAPVVILNGALRSEASNHTRVMAQANTNQPGVVLIFGGAGLLLTMAPASALAYSPNDTVKAVAAVIVIVVPLITYGMSRYFVDYRKKELLGVLAGAFEGGAAQ